MNTNNTTARQTAHYGTNYKVAAHWLNNSLILCNNIGEIDPQFYENYRFDSYDEETGQAVELYQFFLTNCTESEVEFLEDKFSLLFSYSPLLDLYVLCVDHCGTPWDYVFCETTLGNAARELGQDK